MRRIAYVCALLTAGAAAAQDPAWQPLDDAGIRAALSDQRLIYAASWQHFYASGRTLYHAGQDSWGNWEARGNQYCSQWPPADGWACYGVARRGNTVRFVGDSGDITEGRFD